MTTPLKPCPFCGGEASLGNSPDGGIFIGCQTCQSSTCLMYPLKVDGEPLIAEKWNRRAEDEELARLREQVQRLIDQIERCNLTDDLGHRFTMNAAYCEVAQIIKQLKEVK